MGKYWETLCKGKMQDWPYPELKEVSDEDIKRFYTNVGYKGTDYRVAKIEKQNQEAAYHKLGFAFVYVLIAYCVGWLLIIWGVLYVVHSVMQYSKI